MCTPRCTTYSDPSAATPPSSPTRSPLLAPGSAPHTAPPANSALAHLPAPVRPAAAAPQSPSLASSAKLPDRLAPQTYSPVARIRCSRHPPLPPRDPPDPPPSDTAPRRNKLAATR